MKRKLFIAYFIFLHFIPVAFMLKANLRDRILWRLHLNKIEEISGYYEAREAALGRKAKTLPDGSILFIGDSIIEGLAESSIAPNAANFGIGGDTTFGVLQRLPNYGSRKTASAIVLSIGVNDLKHRENEEIIENYRQILDDLTEHCPVIACSVLPLDNSIKSRSKLIRLSDRIAPLNEELAKLVADTERCTFVDLTKALSNSQGNLRTELHVGDGIHLSEAGYKVWTGLVQSELEKIAVKN